jgi:hypothetical protein
MKPQFSLKIMLPILSIIIIVLSSVQVSGQVIGCKGGYRDDERKPGWDRGYCSYMYCGNYPESWVRAKAQLDRGTRTLTIYLQLETDATHAGPMGYAEVFLLGSDGRYFEKFTTNTMGIGGKMPGRFREEIFVSTINLTQENVDKVHSIIVYPYCAGTQDGYEVFNHITKVVNGAMRVVAQFSTISY